MHYLCNPILSILCVMSFCNLIANVLYLIFKFLGKIYETLQLFTADKFTTNITPQTIPYCSLVILDKRKSIAHQIRCLGMQDTQPAQQHSLPQGRCEIYSSTVAPSFMAEITSTSPRPLVNEEEFLANMSTGPGDADTFKQRSPPLAIQLLAQIMTGLYFLEVYSGDLLDDLYFA